MIEIDDDIYYEITNEAVKDIIPNSYFINEDGRVFSTISGRFMNPTLSNTGYYVLNFKTITGKSRTQLLHRIIMITLNGQSSDKQHNFVNHKDGKKTNNDYENFEWVNNAGNIEHAQENNLLQCGELCDWSKLTEAQVREICEHFVNNDYGTLADLSKYYGVSVTTIGDIARRISWKQVSKDYDFDYNIRSHFTADQVHFMCNVFEMHKDQNFNYCYYYIIFNLALPDCRNIRTRIYKIYSKDKNSFSHITSQYDY